jgi:hypothetical protein
MTTTIETDVLVVGAGSAGCAAALAAARQGRAVTIVDRLGFLGGTSTAVLDTFYAFYTAGENPRKVVSGIADLPVDALLTRGRARIRPNSFGSGNGVTYDPETLKIVWTRLLVEAGVRVILGAQFVDAHRTGDRVTGVTVAAKGGPLRVDARAVVDASGDADVVASALGSFQPDTELQQPATVTFRMTGVDMPLFRAEGRPRLPELLEAGRAAGLDLPGRGGSMHESGAPGTVLTALTRVEQPAFDRPEESGSAELAGILQVDDWVEFLVRFVPGFADAALSAISAMAGVRESRRVLGTATLTEEDVLAGRRRDDQIALCGAPIEDLASETTRWVHVGGDGAYGIPFGALVPTGLGGIAVAGRCLSATHAAHASARSMATCMAMGQAAGTAAALAVRAGRDLAEVSANDVRALVRADGGTVD